MAGCCDPGNTKIFKLILNGTAIGLVGIQKTLEEVRKLKISGEEEIMDELLKKVQRDNYVPRSAEADYRKALWEAYQNYLKNQ